MSHTGWLVHALRADESIVVLRADKGNTSVILDTEDYHEKMEELLKDKKFKVLCKDLIRREECGLNKLLKATIWAECVERSRRCWYQGGLVFPDYVDYPWQAVILSRLLMLSALPCTRWWDIWPAYRNCYWEKQIPMLKSNLLLWYRH